MQSIKILGDKNATSVMKTTEDAFLGKLWHIAEK